MDEIAQYFCDISKATVIGCIKLHHFIRNQPCDRSLDGSTPDPYLIDPHYAFVYTRRMAGEFDGNSKRSDASSPRQVPLHKPSPPQLWYRGVGERNGHRILRDLPVSTKKGLGLII